jgi:hypothetical protein
VELLPGLKLVASFLRLQFVEKVEAGLEFRHVQNVNRSLPGRCQRRSNIEDP